MASVKITGIDKVRKDVTDLFNKTRKDPALLLEIAENLQKNVVSNARSGKGPDGKQFPSLSTSWIKLRSYLSGFNSTGEFFIGTSKSNITFTGKFLESIKYRIKPSEGLAIVEPTGNHPGYKTKTGKTKSLSNQTLAKYLEDMGFKFLFVSNAFKKRTSVIVRRFLRREILKNK